MTTPIIVRQSLWQPLRKPRTYVCWQCQQRRAITQNWLRKKEAGREQWSERAREIRANGRKSMLAILKERGFIHAVAGEEEAFDRLMTDKRLGVYCGVDPTARSLHVGHMVPFMALFWMYVHGFHALTLVGASTAGIGDPTGRTTDRPDLSSAERKANLTAIHYQLKRMWVHVERHGKKYGFQPDVHWNRDLVNNAIWWNNVPFLEVLKMLGRGLRLGPMLSRDTVKTKMQSGDGMSFAEFSYPIMQAWDWWHMYNERGVQVQIGGSDQFGNIVAGIDAIKYITKNHPNPDVRQADGVQALTAPYGFTVPLLTTASGAKFGKSAGNAVWLDQDMTSLFDLYGFFVRTADADVERYLKMFTFLPLSEIQSLMDQHKLNPSKRIPQHRLAFEFVDLVHGPEFSKQAQESHQAVFSKPTASSLVASANPLKSTITPPAVTKPNPYLLDPQQSVHERGKFVSQSLNKYAPPATPENTKTEQIILPKSLIYDQTIARIAYAAGLVSSRSEGHRLAGAGGVYVGRQGGDAGPMKDDLSFIAFKPHDPGMAWKYMIRNNEGAHEEAAAADDGGEGLLILRVGKWKVRIVRVVSDEKFQQLGIEGPPAWREKLAQDAAERQKELTKEVTPTDTWRKRAQIQPEPPRSVVEGKTLDELDELDEQLHDILHSEQEGDSAAQHNAYASDEDVNASEENADTSDINPDTSADSSRLMNEYGAIDPVKVTNISKAGRRAATNDAYNLQQAQGRFDFERLRLEKLTKAAVAAGYEPDKVAAKRDNEDRFIAAKLDMQKQFVDRLSVVLRRLKGKVQKQGVGDFEGSTRELLHTPINWAVPERESQKKRLSQDTAEEEFEPASETGSPAEEALLFEDAEEHMTDSDNRSSSTASEDIADQPRSSLSSGAKAMSTPWRISKDMSPPTYPSTPPYKRLPNIRDQEASASANPKPDHPLSTWSFNPPKPNKPEPKSPVPSSPAEPNRRERRIQAGLYKPKSDRPTTSIETKPKPKWKLKIEKKKEKSRGYGANVRDGDGGGEFKGDGQKNINRWEGRGSRKVDKAKKIVNAKARRADAREAKGRSPMR